MRFAWCACVLLLVAQDPPKQDPPKGGQENPPKGEPKGGQDTDKQKATAEEAEPSAQAAPEEGSMRDLMHARVLLVDDNAVNRQVVKLFLTQLAPQIVEAVNGQEAFDCLAKQSFDIVLLDVHMPVMDGKEAIKRIRASGKPWSNIPVIALTADAMSGDKERFLSMGMSDYISKPIDSRELATKYVALLKGKPLVAKTKAA